MHTEPCSRDRAQSRVPGRRLAKWGEGTFSAAKPSKPTTHKTTLQCRAACPALEVLGPFRCKGGMKTQTKRMAFSPCPHPEKRAYVRTYIQQLVGPGNASLDPVMGTLAPAWAQGPLDNLPRLGQPPEESEMGLEAQQLSATCLGRELHPLTAHPGASLSQGHLNPGQSKGSSSAGPQKPLL